MGKIVFNKLFDLMKEKQLSTYKIRKEKIINEATLQRLRNNESVSTNSIASLCKALNCQPADIMEYVDEEKIER
jgi:putative transcriptional regulator